MTVLRRACLAMLLCAAAPISASDDVIPVARFSELAGARLPADWEPLTFPKVERKTTYRVVTGEPGGSFVRAESRASASGLTHRVDVDLQRHPFLRWEWRVHDVLAKGDVTKKSGDDYPARIYVTFAYDPARASLWERARYRAATAIFGEMPFHAINYLWASRAERGLVIGNAYAPDFVKMIVVASGREHLGTWREERRNLLEDYREAFGEDPPRVNGVAIMTDTDDTGEQAVADYRDIRFVAR